MDLVAGIAAGQWGMFTTAQAAAVGVSRLEVARLVDAGLVRRIRQGVYVMPGVPSDAFEDVRAEWLATDPRRTAGNGARTRTRWWSPMSPQRRSTGSGTWPPAGCT